MNSKIPRRSGLLVVLLVACALPASAFGQATRTWVSGVGDDANPCSRTAPCKTFAGAISKTAAGGEINVLDSGGFGAVTITKALTIKGHGVEAGVLVSGTNGIVISAGASDRVRLYGLDIVGLGTGLSGVLVNSARSVRIEHCEINGFTLNGVAFSSSTPSSQLLVQDSSIDGQITNNGIGVAPTAANTKVTVRRTSMDDNANGIIAVGNAQAASVTVTQSGLSGNTIGVASRVFSAFGATVRIGANTITDNATGLAQSGGGQILSFGNNMLTGNGIDGAPNALIGLL